MKDKKVIYGIIGCGSAALSHAKAIFISKDSILRAVFDSKKQKAKDFAKKYNCEVKNSLTQLLKDPKINAVIICTPHHTHSNLILKTLASNKFCITEKPLYLNDKERKKIETMSDPKNLIVVFQVRFHDPVRFLLENVKNGKLGKIQYCSITIRKNRNKKYFSDWHGDKKEVGGMLLNQGMHGLDLMLKVCGTPLKTSGVLRNTRRFSKIEDVYTGYAVFANGAAGNIEMLTCAREEKPENSVLVIGTRGSIKIGGGVFDRVEYAHFDNKKNSLFPKEKDSSGHPKFITAVNNLILRGKKDAFLPFIADGLRANRFAEFLYKTAKNV